MLSISNPGRIDQLKLQQITILVNSLLRRKHKMLYIINVRAVEQIIPMVLTIFVSKVSLLWKDRPLIESLKINNSSCEFHPHQESALSHFTNTTEDTPCFRFCNFHNLVDTSTSWLIQYHQLRTFINSATWKNQS